MKKIIIAFFIIFATINISAQEMQFSGGLEAGFGALKINNDFWFNYGNNYFFCNETINSVFFAPGISFSVRVFSDKKNIISQGFIFRDCAIFIANMEQLGTISINNYSQSISNTLSLADDFFISIMNFDMGISYRFGNSSRLQFYTDLGVNLTIMDSEDYETNDTFKYLGFGIFSGLALQINLKTNLYLELGLNSILNIFSSQEGTYQTPYNTRIEYEDSGRLDLPIVAAYIHIGWRIDL
jgi:hypothetical protein